jgi:hypothetical protein
MESIGEIKKKRFQFLNKLYELSNGNEKAEIPTDYILRGLYKFGRDRYLYRDEYFYESVIQHLGGEGLVRDLSWLAAKGKYLPDAVSITHKGIKEVEQAIEQPQRSTEHFPENIIYIAGNVTDSPIQQGSHQSTQMVSIAENNIEDLKVIIEGLKQILHESSLIAEQQNDIRAEIQTIEGQISSSKPKTKIIIESLSSAKAILDSTSTISATALPIITKIAAWLQGIT